MLHQPCSDLCTNHASDTKQDADSIINIGQLVMHKKGRDRNNQYGEEGCAHRFLEEYPNRSRRGTIKNPPPNPLNDAPTPTMMPMVIMIKACEGIALKSLQLLSHQFKRGKRPSCSNTISQAAFVAFPIFFNVMVFSFCLHALKDDTDAAADVPGT